MAEKKEARGHKAAATEAIYSAVGNLQRVVPFSQDRYIRYALADLETARVELEAVAELKRKRPAKKATVAEGIVVRAGAARVDLPS